MKKIAMIVAALTIASIFVGCKGEEAAPADGTKAGGNGTNDTKPVDTPK